MGLKEEALEKDPKLSTIYTYILRNVPFVNSIILCGSRAVKGVRSSQLSDYDIVLVLKAFCIPFCLQKIKTVEKKLSKKLRVKVNINPLPFFRIRKAKGNLFLFKLKREGITIWGKNYIDMLNPGSVKDISVNCYFSYLSSLMKELVQNFDPNLIHENSNSRARQLLHASAKALFGSGELLLLSSGIYATESEVTLNRLSKKQSAEIRVDIFIDNTVFLDILHKVLRVEKDPFVKIGDILDIYISVKNCLLRMFRFLMREFYHSTSEDLDGLVMDYLRVDKRGSFLKNFEYFVLTVLLKREMMLKSLFSDPQVAQRMFVALIWLLDAVREDSIERQSLEKAYDILVGHIRVRYSEDDVELWRNISCSIGAYWPYACTVMGI